MSISFLFLFSLTGINQAYATSVCYTDNPSICISFADTSYMIDHGALIQVTNPTSPLTDSSGHQFITVTVQETTVGSTSQPVSVQLMQSSTTPSLYSGYVYFQNSALYPTSPSSPVLTVSDPRSNTVTITTSYTDPSFPIPIITNADTITTDIVDNANHGTWPWANPASNTQPSTYKITCPTSNPTIDPDGLCRYWKTSTALKIPYPPQSTTQFYTYNCDATQHPFPLAPNVGNSNVDPQCPTPGGRDIYVEVDYMQGHQPDVTALEHVIDVFAAQNPPIKLHIQLDEQIPLHQDTITAGIGGGSGGTNFDTIKKYYFGTSVDRTTGFSGSLSYQPNLSAKKQAFHYALFYHAQSGSTTSGYSEQPGNDMGISLGDFTGGIGSMDQMEGTFMHELGHNLGLDHGGSDSINCKPNYPSVMSYSHQFADPVSDRRLDYSHGGLSSLTETNLNENTGVGINANHDTIAFGYIGSSDGQPHISFGKADGSSINWDHPDIPVPPDTMDTSTNAMITNFPPSPRVVSTCIESSPRSTAYPDNNDWTSLIYNFKAYTGWSDTYIVPLVGHPDMVVKLHDDNPSAWKINWVANHGYEFMHPIKIPTEITADQVKGVRSQVINDIKYNIDLLPNDVFHGADDKPALDADLNDAYNFAQNGDIISTAHKLTDAKSYFVSNVNPMSQSKINYLFDNAITSHTKSATTRENHPHYSVSISFSNSTYNTGSNASIVVHDKNADINSGLNVIKVMLTSTSDSNGIPLTLLETGVNTGIFQSSMIGITTGNSTSDSLHVHSGDTIQAQYGGANATAHIS